MKNPFSDSREMSAHDLKRQRNKPLLPSYPITFLLSYFLIASTEEHNLINNSKIGWMITENLSVEFNVIGFGLFG